MVRRPVLLIVPILAAALSGCVGSGDADGGAYAPPVATFTAAAADSATGGHSVAFDASDSTAHDATFHWEFGDGTTGAGEKVSHTYNFTNAKPRVVLAILDSAGAIDVSSAEIALGSGANAPPVALYPLDHNVFGVGEEIPLDSTGSTDPDGDALTYRWWLGRTIQGATSHAPGFIPPASSFDIPTQSGFNTGALAKNTYGEVNFTLAGTYTYHCHPHPFMTGTVVVDPAAAPVAGPVVVYEKNFTIWPSLVTVAPNTTVRWVSLDEQPHTATQSTFWQRIDVTAATGTTTVDEVGLYEISLVVSDGKGKEATYSHPLKVVAEAPPATYKKEFNGSASVGEATGNPTGKFDLPYPGNVTVNVTWTAPPQAAGDVVVNLYKGGQAIGTVNATASGAASPLQISKELAKNQYTWELVTRDGGAIVQWEVEVFANLVAKEALAGGHNH